jgi:hypothetical protein
MKNLLITISVFSLGFVGLDSALDKEDAINQVQQTQPIRISTFQRNMTCSTESNSIMNQSVLQARCASALYGRFDGRPPMDVLSICTPLIPKSSSGNISITFACITKIPNKKA